jgi:hypothetical protein
MTDNEALNNFKKALETKNPGGMLGMPVMLMPQNKKEDTENLKKKLDDKINNQEDSMFKFII